jgi:hypothetical protein
MVVLFGEGARAMRWTNSVVFALAVGCSQEGMHSGDIIYLEPPEGAKMLGKPPAPSQRNRKHLRTPDDEFVEICRTVPGFGGMFFDRDGILNVYLTDRSQEEHAKAVVRAVLEAKRGGLPRRPKDHQDRSMFRPVLRWDHVKILQGQYSFDQLVSWKRHLSSKMALEGWTRIDADESVNRVVLGIEPGIPDEPFRNLVSNLGIPNDAVVIEEQEGLQQL